MKVLHIAILFVLWGCSNSTTKIESETGQRSSIPWEESMVKGASFSSIPDSGIISLRFPAKGNHVLVTIGDRNDALAGPIWYWSIDANGLMILSEESGEIMATLELVAFKKHEVIIRLGEKNIIYLRTGN